MAALRASVPGTRSLQSVNINGLHLVLSARECQVLLSALAGILRSRLRACINRLNIAVDGRLHRDFDAAHRLIRVLNLVHPPMNARACSGNTTNMRVIDSANASANRKRTWGVSRECKNLSGSRFAIGGSSENFGKVGVATLQPDHGRTRRPGTACACVREHGLGVAAEPADRVATEGHGDRDPRDRSDRRTGEGRPQGRRSRLWASGSVTCTPRSRLPASRGRRCCSA